VNSPCPRYVDLALLTLDFSVPTAQVLSRVHDIAKDDIFIKSRHRVACICLLFTVHIAPMLQNTRRP